MGCGTAGVRDVIQNGFLLKIQIYRKIVEIANVLLKLQNDIQLNILMFLVAFYVFFYRKKVKNAHFYSKIA